MFDLTTRELWLRVHGWAKKYGEMSYMHILGQDVLFLNKAEVAFELLDKRGAIYSGKPRLIMVGEMCGCENMVPFTTYNEAFKRRRKLMQLTLGPRSIPSYHQGLETETKTFIRSLVSDPINYLWHIRRYAGGLTLSVVYGYKALSSNDPYLVLAEECMDLLANKMASGPGIWPVDVFPILQYLPAWFPGGSFKTNAAIWKVKMDEFIEKPWAHAKARMKAGIILPSFCSSLLDKDEEMSAEQEDDLKYTANSMYAASADTTVATISHLILAMIYYPDAFVKARQQVEEVIGKERLPTFSDRASLPYLDCILNETWRWGSPVPLNLPHSVLEEDVYHGKKIRKGSIVIANIWAMLRDESIYPDASTFKPERFMEDVSLETKKKMDPRNYIFGFGRRRCPGADLVDSSIWLLLATMIATVDISKPQNPDGSTVEPHIDFNNMVFRTPRPFKFSVKLRSHLLEED
jgi:cytochrome P450